jgi:hypothetical protein
MRIRCLGQYREGSLVETGREKVNGARCLAVSDAFRKKKADR